MRGSRSLVTLLLSTWMRSATPSGLEGTSQNISRRVSMGLLFVIRAGLVSALWLLAGGGCSSLSEVGTTLSGQMTLQRNPAGEWSVGLGLSSPERLPEMSGLQE